MGIIGDIFCERESLSAYPKEIRGFLVFFGGFESPKISFWALRGPSRDQKWPIIDIGCLIMWSSMKLDISHASEGK